MRRALILSLALASPALAADVVTEWNDTMLSAIATTSAPPPRASRAMAMVSGAVYDAVNSIDRTHQAYLYDVKAPAGTSREAAAVEAAYATLTTLFPTQTAVFDAKRTASLAAIPDGPAKTNGLMVGKNAADAMLLARNADGSANNPTYTPGMNPGDWRPTPPAFAPALLPGWGSVTPFAMASGSQFRPSGPPALNSAQYTAAFNEVKELGNKFSATRTADQTEIALFWADGAGTVTPPGHWNEIAKDVAEQEGNSLYDNARMLALLNLSLADAAIAAWDSKYTYNHWRPVTAIREADTDGNDDTLVDPTWEPLIATPPFPAYISGHSTFSATAASILAEFYGTDGVEFTTDSGGLPGVFRHFTSFSDAADEAGQSRIYGGIHWQYDNQDGLDTGRKIGPYVFDNYLQPVPEPTSVLLLVGGAVLASRRRG